MFGSDLILRNKETGSNKNLEIQFKQYHLVAFWRGHQTAWQIEFFEDLVHFSLKRKKNPKKKKTKSI